MNKQFCIRNENKKPIAILIVAIVAAVGLIVSAATEIAANQSNENKSVEIYEDFSDGGAEYVLKWVTWDNTLFLSYPFIPLDSAKV